MLSGMRQLYSKVLFFSDLSGSFIFSQIVGVLLILGPVHLTDGYCNSTGNTIRVTQNIPK